MSEKFRSSFLTVAQEFDLNVACRALRPFGYGTYHVGSSLVKADYHDVDLRCMLEDDEYDRMFPNEEGVEARRLFLNRAVSEWIAARTGLPIDFQFQKASEANQKYPFQRNSVGCLP